MPAEVRRLTTPEQVSLAAAEEFTKLAAASIAAEGRFTVALAGGSTPKRMYQLLAEPDFRDRIAWNRIEFFWGDERSVPPTHADSNFRMANEALLSKLPIVASQIHRMQADRSDLEAAAEDYQDEIARVLGRGPDRLPPSLDLVLLGMGPDGHTASLFPHTLALGEMVRWVIPNWVEKFQTFRMTMTTAILLQAKNIVFCVAGADKAQPLAEVLVGPQDAGRLPSQLILGAHGRLEWLVDEAAAAKLSKA